MPRNPFRRGSSPRIRRRLTSVAAGVAIGAVVVTGSVALEPPQPAQAAWQGGFQEWLGGLNSSLGTAGQLFGVQTGPFNIAMSLAGPLISAIFGSGGGPGIEDVLDKLQELDDIEHKLDVMQSELVEIHQNVLDVDLKVVMGTCTLQTEALPSYIANLKTSQDTYSEVLTAIEEVRTGGQSEVPGLKYAIDAFIAETMGSATQYDVVSSRMAHQIRDVHEHLVTSSGRTGAIESCGVAYYEAWKLQQTSASARAATTEADRGVWLDDRQYYEPLQQMLRYWQTAEAQGMFLLQQAALMQAALQYTQVDKKSLQPAEAASVCRSAENDHAGGAKFVCRSALNFSNTLHDMIVDEWKQAGLPISDDKVVMSLGTDITGVTNNGETMASLVWARKPDTDVATWAKGTWNQTTTPVSYDGIGGFSPANSTQWNTLLSGYATSHTTVIPFVQQPVQTLGSDTWGTAGVQPFAPFDLLTLMRENVIPGQDARAFDTSGVSMVWMPNEIATRDMPNWRFEGPKGETFGWASRLTFAPSAATGWSDRDAHYYWETDMGLAVRCMVVPVDGMLCGSETIASWFIAHQKAAWERDRASFTVTPSSPVLGQFEAETYSHVRCQSWRERPMVYPTGCEWHFDGGVSQAPEWLASMTLIDGRTYDTATSAQTLWPVAALPTDCPKTLWGAPTRCGASMDAWLKATIPNPKAPGPQPAAALAIAGTTDGASCTAPAWTPNPTETGVPVQSSDVTWSAWLADGLAFSVTSKQGDVLSLTHQIAEAAGWWTQDKGAAEKATSFSLRCSLDARFTDLATVSTVSSTVAVARYADGKYTIQAAAGGGAGAPDAGTPSASPAPVAGAPGSGSLAATGAQPVGWIALAALVLVVGGALTALTRRRRSRS